MKKSIISLALVLVVALVCIMTGCSNAGADETSTSDGTRSAVTLNFYIITGDETTDEAKASVQAAFNEITETTYTTHVEFVFCTADEYRSIMDEKLEYVSSMGGYIPNGSTSGEVATTVDDIGMTVTAYPAVSDTQVDIVLIKGYDMLLDYVDNYYLSELNTYLKGDFKTLKSYIYGAILESAYLVDKDGETVPNTIIADSAPYSGYIYAIPNNSLVGEYKYMLINKELANEFYYSESDFSGFTADSTADFAKLIYDKYGNTSEICPLLNTLDYPLAVSWPLGTESSIAITAYRAAEVLGSRKNCVNLFDNSAFVTWTTKMLSLVESGYVSNDPDKQEKYGVAFVSGSYADREKYADDYYVKVIDYPRIEEDDVFGSMLAVSAFSANANRAMEIIAALTTNSELRNILQYGIEGVHYEIEDDGSLVRLNHDYMMDSHDTGNALISYPEEGVDPTSWYNSIQYQNREAKLSTIFGFAAWMPQLTTAQVNALKTLSDEYLGRVAECKTVSEFEAVIAEAKSAVSSNSNASSAIKSINSALGTWWEAVFYVDESEA